MLLERLFVLPHDQVLTLNLCLELTSFMVHGIKSGIEGTNNIHAMNDLYSQNNTLAGWGFDAILLTMVYYFGMHVFHVS